MSNHYEDELGRSRARRSRKQLSQQDDRQIDAGPRFNETGRPSRSRGSEPVERGSQKLSGDSFYSRYERSSIGARSGDRSDRGALSGRAERTGSTARHQRESGAADIERQRAERGRSNRTKRDSNKKPKNKTRNRIIVLMIAEIVTLFAIYMYAYAYKIYSTPQRPTFRPEEYENQELTGADLKKMKGYWLIAIFGVDGRDGSVNKGVNADVSMICRINQDTGEVKLVSVFRDTYLNTDDQNTYNKVNSAYAKGGPELAVKVLNKNLDLNITDYITFNWKSVAEAINILGGIELEISPAEFKYINGFITETVKSTGIGSNHLKKAGMNQLDGIQAVSYGRLRLMDTDYARTERQRKIIKLAFDKAKTAEYSVLNNILVTVLPQVATSLNFADLTNVALNITKYRLGETSGFPMQRGEANMGKKGACVVPATLESNVIRLHQFLFGDEVYAPTELVKKISAKIASDTGVYKEGQVRGDVGTKGSLPKETKAPVTTEEVIEEEYNYEEELGDYPDGYIPDTDPATNRPLRLPGIGETDEFGDLVDPPEEPGEGLEPGYPYSSTETRPEVPSTSGWVPGPATEQTRPVTPGVVETTPAPGPGVNPPPGSNPVGPWDETTGGKVPNAPAPGGNSSMNNGLGDLINSNGPGV